MDPEFLPSIGVTRFLPTQPPPETANPTRIKQTAEAFANFADFFSHPETFTFGSVGAAERGFLRLTESAGEGKDFVRYCVGTLSCGTAVVCVGGDRLHQREL